jgi:DNA-binding transcriptional regulator YiaG
MAFTQDNDTLVNFTGQGQLVNFIAFFLRAVTMKKEKGRKKMWTPDKIRELREAFGERQVDFCRRVGVSLPALQCWEQGKGEPGGSAQILLDRLEEDLRDGRIEQTA